MTLPAVHKRTTVAERRANRAAFKALKEQQRAGNREKNRHSDYRHSAREKLRRIAKGETILPWTARMLSVLKPQEARMLELHVQGRLLALTAEERQRVRQNLYLALSCMGTDDWLAFTQFGTAKLGR